LQVNAHEHDEQLKLAEKAENAAILMLIAAQNQNNSDVTESARTILTLIQQIVKILRQDVEGHKRA
jgi:hypothetical protein